MAPSCLQQQSLTEIQWELNTLKVLVVSFLKSEKKQVKLILVICFMYPVYLIYYHFNMKSICKMIEIVYILICTESRKPSVFVLLAYLNLDQHISRAP